MINWIQKKRNKKGFTLVELVVVIAILGILAAIAIPRFNGVREDANANVVLANLRSIKSGVEIYAVSNNLSPDSVTDAQAKEMFESNALNGPGTTSYTVTSGKAIATIPAGLPFPKSHTQLEISGQAITIK